MQPLPNQSNHVDVQYKALVNRILTEGRLKGDRTGTGTLSLFGAQMRFNLAEGFPLLTTKKVNLRSIIHELLWFLDGKTNAKDLDCGIWDDWQVTAETIVMKWLDDSDRETKLAIRDVLDMSDIYRVVKSERAVEAVLTELKEETGKEWFAIKVSSQSTECGIKGYWDTALDRCIEKGLIPVHVLGDLGELGPVYGKVWRSWLTQSGDTIDQIQEIVDSLKHDPDSRRMLVSGWNPELLPDTKYSPDRNALEGKQALPPCHTMFQFYSDDCTLEERLKLALVSVSNDMERQEYLCDLYNRWMAGVTRGEGETDAIVGIHSSLESELHFIGVPKKRLSCQLYMRSNDVGLGWSFNVASYALLVMIIARQVGMAYGDFVWTGGDVHIYRNHLAGLEEQMTRQERQMPTMKINRPIGTAFDDYKPEDFILENYDPHPAIKFPIAV